MGVIQCDQHYESAYIRIAKVHNRFKICTTTKLMLYEIGHLVDCVGVLVGQVESVQIRELFSQSAS